MMQIVWCVYNTPGCIWNDGVQLIGTMKKLLLCIFFIYFFAVYGIAKVYIIITSARDFNLQCHNLSVQRRAILQVCMASNTVRYARQHPVNVTCCCGSCSRCDVSMATTTCWSRDHVSSPTRGEIIANPRWRQSAILYLYYTHWLYRKTPARAGRLDMAVKTDRISYRPADGDVHV